VCEGPFCISQGGSISEQENAAYKDPKDLCQEISSRPAPDLTTRRSGAIIHGKTETCSASPDVPYPPYREVERPQIATLSHTANPRLVICKEGKERQENGCNPRTYKDFALLTDPDASREEVGSGTARYHGAISRSFSGSGPHVGSWRHTRTNSSSHHERTIKELPPSGWVVTQAERSNTTCIPGLWKFQAERYPRSNILDRLDHNPPSKKPRPRSSYGVGDASWASQCRLARGG
jgi:hypothetical protein